MNFMNSTNAKKQMFDSDYYLIQIDGIFIVNIHDLIVFIIVDIVIIILVVQRTSSGGRTTATIALWDYHVTENGK